MKKVNIELTENRAKEIADIYPTQKEGLVYALENYMNIRANRLPLLKGVFTREELIAMIDAQNGTMYEPRFAMPEYFAMGMDDAEKYQNSCSNHGAEVTQLVAKIRNMHPADCLILVEEIFRFWYVDKAYKQNLEKFVERFM